MYVFQFRERLIGDYFVAGPRKMPPLMESNVSPGQIDGQFRNLFEYQKLISINRLGHNVTLCRWLH
jgi:hypothetical protein